MGNIILNQIGVNAIIGTLPQERCFRQRLFFDVDIEVDMSAAMKSDALTDAVDYSDIERRLVSLVEKSSFQLLEALIYAVAQEIMSDKRVARCKISVSKPRASEFGRSVTVSEEFFQEAMGK